MSADIDEIFKNVQQLPWLLGPQPTLKQAAVVAAWERLTEAGGRKPKLDEIAGVVGCTRSTVIRTLRKYGLANKRPLTSLQAAILAYRDSFEMDRGYPPTQVETAVACGCSTQLVFETFQRCGKTSPRGPRKRVATASAPMAPASRGPRTSLFKTPAATVPAATPAAQVFILHAGSVAPA